MVPRGDWRADDNRALGEFDAMEAVSQDSEARTFTYPPVPLKTLRNSAPVIVIYWQTINRHLKESRGYLSKSQAASTTQLQLPPVLSCACAVDSTRCSLAVAEIIVSVDRAKGNGNG